MYDPVHALIHANPKFHRLARERQGLAWILSAIMLGFYLGFILLIAFKPEWLGTRVDRQQPMTWGIPIGIGLIVSAFVLTGIYIRSANDEFDRLTREIIEEAGA